MRARPNFALHHEQTLSDAMTRLYKHIRSLQPDYTPKSHYAASIQHKKAMKPKLRLVK